MLNKESASARVQLQQRQAAQAHSALAGRFGNVKFELACDVGAALRVYQP
jgi:hypothetical protein